MKMPNYKKPWLSLAWSGCVAVFILSLTTGKAVAQATLTGCYVPASGTVYRIKGAGLPDACRSKNHVEFTWSLQGPVGAAGPTGPTGPRGPAGPAGGLPATGLQVIGTSGEDVAPGATGTVTSNCPEGKVATGGGFEPNQT